MSLLPPSMVPVTPVVDEVGDEFVDGGHRANVADRKAGPKGRILWPYAGSILVFHLLLPLCFVPGLFSWWGVLWLPVGNYIFCSCGIGAGYHRLLTHRSFKCPKWVEHTLAMLGVFSFQGSPIRWVTTHRMHHQHSDQDIDPHSPASGWFWGHMGWVLVEDPRMKTLGTYERYARDLFRDRFYRKLERNSMWIWLYLAHALAFYFVGLGVGYAVTGDVWEGVRIGAMVFLWGVVARTVYTWHVTWAVNSVAHMWGYRNYETEEGSRNNWLVALSTNGEGWHNNHHADPRSAAHGFHRWWELDVTYGTIRTLKALGLAWDVVPPRRKDRMTSRRKV